MTSIQLLSDVHSKSNILLGLLDRLPISLRNIKRIHCTLLSSMWPKKLQNTLDVLHIGVRLDNYCVDRILRIRFVDCLYVCQIIGA